MQNVALNFLSRVFEMILSVLLFSRLVRPETLARAAHVPRAKQTLLVQTTGWCFAIACGCFIALFSRCLASQVCLELMAFGGCSLAASSRNTGVG